MKFSSWLFNFPFYRLCLFMLITKSCIICCRYTCDIQSLYKFRYNLQTWSCFVLYLYFICRTYRYFHPQHESTRWRLSMLYLTLFRWIPTQTRLTINFTETCGELSSWQWQCNEHMFHFDINVDDGRNSVGVNHRWN